MNFGFAQRCQVGSFLNHWLRRLATGRCGEPEFPPDESAETRAEFVGTSKQEHWLVAERTSVKARPSAELEWTNRDKRVGPPEELSRRRLEVAYPAVNDKEIEVWLQKTQNAVALNHHEPVAFEGSKQGRERFLESALSDSKPQ